VYDKTYQDENKGVILDGTIISDAGLAFAYAPAMAISEHQDSVLLGKNNKGDPHRNLFSSFRRGKLFFWYYWSGSACD